ncbi:hypothetical protein AWC38_SpisGene20156 [Stylophora pistillata]|uniref:Fibrinogen C-terminal domain-containing protein n=1 Tax=Stylophora pistillata TaxID=50429 RepID=A0A2B4RFP1_STYPI|nr:hypothetical protein AWC38_SpisGene20156 [Stylophora pistillata]
MICSSESRCRSLNFRIKDKSCDLNDANKHTHPGDFGPKEGSVYMNKVDEFKSCSEILNKWPDAESGYYWIDIGSRKEDVYCDMEKHGGGWTLVVDISSNNNDHLQSVRNNCINDSLCVPFTDQDQGRKLGDSDIHELARTEGTFRVDVLKSNGTLSHTVFYQLSQASEQCRRSTYSEYGHHLSGHVVSTQKTSSISECVMICSSESRCKSLNFRLKDKSCDLNDANKHTHPGDFGAKEGSVYMNKVDEFKSCSEIFNKWPDAESGYYWIDIGSRKEDVYCDMEKHGGGWTLVVSISSENNDHLQSAPNNCLNTSLCVPFTDQDQGRKLSDSDIHELARTEGTFRVDVLKSDRTLSHTVFYQGYDSSITKILWQLSLLLATDEENVKFVKERRTPILPDFWWNAVNSRFFATRELIYDYTQFIEGGLFIELLFEYPVDLTNSTQHAAREIVHELSYHIPIPIIGRLTTAQALPWDIAFFPGVTVFLMDTITMSAIIAPGRRPSTPTNGHYMATHALRYQTMTVVGYIETVQEGCTSSKQFTEQRIFNVKFKFTVTITTILEINYSSLRAQKD